MTDTSFWKRAGLLPVQPALWTRAAGWRLGEVLLPLLVLTLVLYGSLGGFRTWQARRDAARWIERYDTAHPAMTIENGRLRVEGDEVIRFDEDGKTFLVDPRETVPLESITTSEYVVVREREILRKRGLRTEVIRFADLQTFLPDPLRIDGSSLRALESRWGFVLGALLFVLVMAVLLVKEALAAAVFSPIAAGVVRQAVKGGAALRFGQCLNVALAAYSLLVLLEFVLTLSGRSPGACVGLWLWPTLLTGLTFWRARLAVPPEAGAVPSYRHMDTGR